MCGQSQTQQTTRLDMWDVLEISQLYWTYCWLYSRNCFIRCKYTTRFCLNTSWKPSLLGVCILQCYNMEDCIPRTARPDKYNIYSKPDGTEWPVRSSLERGSPKAERRKHEHFKRWFSTVAQHMENLGRNKNPWANNKFPRPKIIFFRTYPEMEDL